MRVDGVSGGVLVAAALVSIGAAIVWGRSARRARRVVRRVAVGGDEDAGAVARATERRDIHAASLHLVLAAVLVAATAGPGWVAGAALAALGPWVLTAAHQRHVDREMRLTEGRSSLERRALEVLSQEDLAPRRWAARLAPEELPALDGFAVGAVYRAGTGMMAGDFYDLFRTSPNRLVVVIGDVTGHGIEPSITAFQTKYLLRVFCEQFRDPGQALTELNRRLVSLGRPEELVSLFVAVLDTEAATLRYASAGHPPAWFWHDREARPLPATGPLLTLDAEADFSSREWRLDSGDLLLTYTDGLTEARNGAQMFGEDRVGQMVRRHPNLDPQDLSTELLEAATRFSDEAIADDVAILAVRYNP